MGDAELGDSARLERLELDPAAPDAPDTLRLVQYLTDQGAGEEELAEAARTGTLGSLALELALRSPGERVAFSDAVERAGMAPDEAAAIWRALGLPDPVESSVELTSAEAETLLVVGEIGRYLGRDTVLHLARVMGGSLAQIAEAVVDAFRVNVEMPQRISGESYSKVVQDYASTSSVMFPALTHALADVLREHVLAVSRSAWALDEEQATVTRERTVGFADLVGYTERARALSPAALAAAINRFESHVGDAVARAGGRVVKLIGDEVMFVVDDPASGCELAATLVDRLADDDELPSVRIGLAAGPVVALHGDYYGDVVNFAARLVKTAEPDEVLVSAAVAEHASGGTEFEPAELPPLKGYDEQRRAFRLKTGGPSVASPSS